MVMIFDIYGFFKCVGDIRYPRGFVHALGEIKRAILYADRQCGLITDEELSTSAAIIDAYEIKAEAIKQNAWLLDGGKSFFKRLNMRMREEISHDSPAAGVSGDILSKLFPAEESPIFTADALRFLITVRLSELNDRLKTRALPESTILRWDLYGLLQLYSRLGFCGAFPPYADEEYLKAAERALIEAAHVRVSCVQSAEPLQWRDIRLLTDRLLDIEENISENVSREYAERIEWISFMQYIRSVYRDIYSLDDGAQLSVECASPLLARLFDTLFDALTVIFDFTRNDNES